MSDPSAPNPSASAPGAPVFAPPGTSGYIAPAGYPAPAGYVPPYVLPGAGAGAVQSPFAPDPRSSTMGLIALFAALVAAIVAPIVAAVAGFNIGVGTGREIALLPSSTEFDWSVLSPVRDWVLLGEIAFWSGTLLGLGALIQGIAAIVVKAGRVQGIVAVVLAAIGPILFGVALQVALVAGFAAGASIGG